MTPIQWIVTALGGVAVGWALRGIVMHRQLRRHMDAQRLGVKRPGSPWKLGG